jgi:hypothetical protein
VFVVQSRIAPHAWEERQAWQVAAASGIVSKGPAPPHGRPQALSQLTTVHRYSGANVDDTPMGWLSTVHLERHAGSPLHEARHEASGAHDGSRAHSFASLQQFALTQSAHAPVYGIPHATLAPLPGGSSPMPTI